MNIKNIFPSWSEGRQGSGYYVMPLICSNRLRFDSYILKFPDKSYIDDHKDPVEKGIHVRINIVIKKPSAGGVFACEKTILNLPRLKIFRPDKYNHSVSEVFGKPRIVLSVGFNLINPFSKAK